MKILCKLFGHNQVDQKMAEIINIAENRNELRKQTCRRCEETISPIKN